MPRNADRTSVKIIKAGRWWHTPVITALGRQRRAFKFEVSLVYRVSFRTAGATQRNLGLNQSIKIHEK